MVSSLRRFLLRRYGLTLTPLTVALVLASGCSLTSLDYLQEGASAGGADSGGTGGGGGSGSSGGGGSAGTGEGGIASGGSVGQGGTELGPGGEGGGSGQGGAEPEVPDCTDGEVTADETDVDCGGRTCMPCADELRCVTGTDCASAICTNQVCQPPSCNDLALNGDETDLNCGGSCAPCAQGSHCVEDKDCATSACVEGVCITPNCVDGELKSGCPLLVDNTPYTFSPGHAPTRCLDEPTLSASDGTALAIYACNDQLRQTFWAVAQADGYFALRNALSGKCLQVRGASTEAGGVIEQSGCDYSPEQLWKPSLAGSNSMRLTSKLSGLPLDVAGQAVDKDQQGIVQGKASDMGADTRWTVKARPPASYAALVPILERTIGVRHDGSTTTLANERSIRAHWKVVPGLADKSWISFQSRTDPGRYLRHARYQLWTDTNDGSSLFKQDATFRYVKPLTGTETLTMSVESINYRGHYWKRDGSIIKLQSSDDSTDFKNAATWLIKGH